MGSWFPVGVLCSLFAASLSTLHGTSFPGPPWTLLRRLSPGFFSAEQGAFEGRANWSNQQMGPSLWITRNSCCGCLGYFFPLLPNIFRNKLRQTYWQLCLSAMLLQGWRATTLNRIPFLDSTSLWGSSVHRLHCAVWVQHKEIWSALLQSSKCDWTACLSRCVETLTDTSWKGIVKAAIVMWWFALIEIK